MDKKEKEHCGKFFDEYDAVFLLLKGVPQADKAKVKKAVGDMAGYLVKRANARAAGKPLPAPTPADKANAKLLADMQLKIFRQFYGNPLDFAKIQPCFVAFANGELRTGKIDPVRGAEREPNGSYFFLFAEFALLAVELGIDAADWTELARIMVKAEEVFLSAYPPKGGAGVFRPRRFKKGGQVTEETKKKLHEKYEKKTLQEIIDCHNKHLKKAATQPNVAYIPPSREDRYLARVEDRIMGLLDKAVLISRQPSPPPGLLQVILSDVRALLQGELGRTAYFSQAEGPESVSETVDTTAAEQQLAGMAAANVVLSSIQVENRGIGRDFEFDFQIGGSSVRLQKDMPSGSDAYEIGANVFSQVISLHASGPVNIPVIINIVEDDPSFDDTGSVSGSIALDPDLGQGTAVISGSIEASKAETGFANFTFSFDWELG